MRVYRVVPDRGTIRNQICNASLPEEKEPLELELTLRMNLPPGLYALGSGLRDSERGKSASQGPSAHMKVVQVERHRSTGWGHMEVVEPREVAANLSEQPEAALGSTCGH